MAAARRVEFARRKKRKAVKGRAEKAFKIYSFCVFLDVVYPEKPGDRQHSRVVAAYLAVVGGKYRIVNAEKAAQRTHERQHIGLIVGLRAVPLCSAAIKAGAAELALDDPASAPT